jgi:TPR repeat protein
VPRDVNRAMALLAKLAEENYSSADLQLGMLFETGEGGAKIDLAAAARHYDRACRNEEWRSVKTNGRQLACYRLARMMFAGRGVAKDTSKAADLLKGAALNGIRPAQIPYALYLLTGDPDNLDIGSTAGPDDAEARRLLENAAKAGNTAAAEILARLNARKP